jgi:hypothetical protein
MEAPTMARLRKKEARTIAIDPELWKLAERAAKREDVTVSQYISGAVMWDLVTDGDIDALKLFGGRLRELVREKFGSPVALGAKLVKGGGRG